MSSNNFIEIINFTPNGAGDIWINIILWLVNLTSVVGGVVLFTVLLKLVTFPFDFMSKWSMRKNSLKMEQMRPELEKLQKQYADNKQMYNQKMMALYKKNGYSMFGACLPTILTLVIFIIAINGFQSYAGYQNRQNFYNMSVSYNNVAYAGFNVDGEYINKDKYGKIFIDCEKLLDTVDANEQAKLDDLDIRYEKNEVPTQDGNSINGTIFVWNKDSYICYVENYNILDLSKPNERVWLKNGKYTINEENYQNLDNIDNKTFAKAENNKLTIKINNKQYNFDQAFNYELENVIYKNYVKNVEKANQGKGENEKETPLSFTAYQIDYVNEILDYKVQYAFKFINDIQQEKSAETYNDEKADFLWIQNIWATDSPMAHPVEANWNTFKQTHNYTGNNIGNTKYQHLIGKLKAETTAPNGYFILIALTIGVTFLTQVIMGKMQKAQMELQTVNGQGAQTQKMMKWMMPIMMAIFSFMYTAAFSMYIVLSSIIGLLTTFLTNAIVNRKFKKVEIKQNEEPIRGRVYVKKEEPKQEENKKKKNKNEKFAHDSGEDFLSGKAGKGHIRGRLK